MKNLLLLAFTLLFSIVIACQHVGKSVNNPALKPGDEIGGMIITTGMHDAAPLWAFCSPVREDGHARSVDCRVPSLSKLAIGHTLGLADPVLQALDWSTLNWELSLDGQTVDLKAFGTYDYLQPDLALSPSPIREVFREFKAWDVILIHPTSGAHTLFGRAQDESEIYAWTVNFTVDAARTP